MLSGEMEINTIKSENGNLSEMRTVEGVEDAVVFCLFCQQALINYLMIQII